MPYKWPTNKFCCICNKEYYPGDIINSRCLTKELKNTIYKFLYIKLNKDLTQKIITYFDEPYYAHTQCLSREEKNKDVLICWYLLENNNMYVCNQYYQTTNYKI